MRRTKPAPYIETRTDRGKVSWRVVYYDEDGKRKRPSYPNEKAAKAFLKDLNERHDKVGKQRAVLLSQNPHDAANALEILQPYKGVTLTEAATFYVQRYLKYRGNRTFNEYFQDLLKKVTRKERAKRSIDDLSSKNSIFLSSYGNLSPRDLEWEKFEEWFFETAEEREWTPRTMVNYRSKIAQLMNFVVEAGAMETNLCSKLELPEVKDTTPEIYTVLECAKLLNNAEEFGLLAYVAFALFGGLRPEKEAKYIKLDYIHDTDELWVSDEISKRHARSVTIESVLKEWLDYALNGIKEDPITNPVNFRRRRENLAKKAGVKWKYDGLRHTYGSMLYAYKGDKRYVIDQMGHKGDDSIFDKHYKRLVRKDVAAEFWNLCPLRAEQYRYIFIKDITKKGRHSNAPT